MEKSGKIEDGVIDSLLQGFMKRQTKPDSNCEAFDPDLANAYLERVMTAKEQAGYEGHLSECTPCRKQIVALARLIEAEVPELKVAAVAAATPAAAMESAGEAMRMKTAGEAPANWFSRLKGWLGILATPRFALAAAAALILAITIPYVLIQNSKVSQSDVAQAAKDGRAAEEKLQGNTPPSTPANPASSLSETDKGQAQANKPADGKPSPTPPPPGAPATTAAGPEGTTSGTAGATAAKEKEEAVADESKKNEAAKTTDTASGSVAQPPAEAGKTDTIDKQPGRIEPKDAQRVEDTDKDTSHSVTIKPGNKVGGSNNSTAPVVRPDPPKPAPPASGRSSETPSNSIKTGRSFKEPSESARDRAAASSSRRVGKKTFWLIDDIWTDENYRSDKEMPIVPLIKDSETYKNTLEKYSELKKFFSAFGPNERVIVVRKDMAYKLIPQDGNK